MTTWREILAPTIARVIGEVGASNDKLLRQALRKAYPCGERAMWPYKVWCDEIHRQLGTKKKPRRVRVAMENQASLF